MVTGSGQMNQPELSFVFFTFPLALSFGVAYKERAGGNEPESKRRETMNIADVQRSPNFVSVRDRLEEGDYTALLVEYREPGLLGGDAESHFNVEVYDLIGTLVAYNASHEDADLGWWIANTIEEWAG
jgi:hypothetical protein